MILADGDTIQPRHLNLSFRERRGAAERSQPGEPLDLSGTLADATRRVVAEVERRKILLALEEAGGQKPPRGRPAAGELQDTAAEDQGLRDRPLSSRCQRPLSATDLPSDPIVASAAAAPLPSHRRQWPWPDAGRRARSAAGPRPPSCRAASPRRCRALAGRRSPAAGPAGDQRGERVAVLCRHAATGNGQVGGHQHAAGDRLAVPEAPYFVTASMACPRCARS